MPAPEDIPTKMRAIKDLQAVTFDPKFRFMDELLGYMRERGGRTR
jgi:hypothetical protein